MPVPSHRIDREPRAVPMRSAVEAAVLSVRAEAEAKGIVLEVPPVQEWVIAFGEELAPALADFVATAVNLSPPGARVWVECEAVAGHVELRLVDRRRRSILCLPAAAAAPTDPFLFEPHALRARQGSEPRERERAA